ncbi:MAG: DUF2079 domain-containing protein [Lentimicrobiaceae bacterium]|jgi:uncharacterized membrane protein
MAKFIAKHKIPYLILIAFGILLFIMGIANHYFFRTVTYDYGVYNFAFWDYSHFRISQNPAYQGTFLQDHFSFTLMYFVPVFWLFNWLTGAYTLILIQNAMILVAAWFSYKLVMLKSKDIWLGIGIMVYYFVILGRYTTLGSDCNIAVISACFVPVFLYFFELKKYIYAFIILVLALFSRENIPIWFVFIFIVLIIEHRKEKKIILISLLGILISVVYFILLFKVFIPAIETADKKFTLFNYGALGVNPSEAIVFIAQHPVEAVKMFFVNHLNNPAYDGIKSEFYWVYFLSGGFILLLRPKYLIWFIPIVAQKVLNDSIYRWGISIYYSIEIVTLLPLSVYLVLSEIKSKYFRYGLAVAVCAITLGVTIYKLNPVNCRIPWTMHPEKETIYDKSFFKAQFNIQKVNNLLALVPDDARVSASDHILPHLAQRQYIYIFPTVEDAEYIVFSVLDDNWLIPHEDNEKVREKYLTSPEWEIIAKEYPVVLLKKIELQRDRYIRDSKLKTGILMSDMEKIDESKQHVLFSNNETADTLTNRSDETAHSGMHSIKLSKENQFSKSLNFSDFKELKYMQVSIWRSPNGKTGNLVASCGNYFYQSVNSGIETDSTGWEKLELKFLVPEQKNDAIFTIYLWNSGPEPVYFDDLLIKKF